MMINLKELNTESQFKQFLVDVDWSVPRLKRRIADIFRDISWKDKDICEVGCGRAEISIYMALTGAKSILAIDPGGDGASLERITTRTNWLQSLRLPNLVFQPTSFEDVSVAPCSLDIIFGISSINHFFETRLPLLRDDRAAAHYMRVFNKFYDLLRPNGVLVLSDAARHNFWGDIHVKTPITRNIDWNIHQSPNTWAAIAERVGFKRINWHWHTPYGFTPFRPVFDNRVAQYFSFSYFHLIAHK